MYDDADKKDLKKKEKQDYKTIFKKLIRPENTIRIASVIIQILLTIGLILVLAYIVVITLRTMSIGLLDAGTEILENSLLIIVFVEIYLSAIDFFRGKGRSLIYVMDATISFLLREIIIGVFTQSASMYYLLGLGGIIGIISFGRYVITRTEKIKRKKRK